MGRKKRSIIKVHLLFDFLNDIFKFLDIRACQNVSLVSRMFFYMVKKRLYKDNPRSIRAVYLGSEFFKGKFAYHVLYQWTSACPENETARYYYHHCGSKCCQKPPLPEVAPPPCILGFGKILIDDFIGTGTEAFKLLRCSKRLFDGKKCLIEIHNHQKFLERHRFKRLAELIGLFKKSSSLAFSYTETEPAHYDLLANQLLHCKTVFISSQWWNCTEENWKNIVHFAKLAIGNLLTWLHHSKEEKTLIRENGNLTPWDFRKKESGHFDAQLFDAIKEKFLTATKPCSFHIHMAYHFYDHDFHHYDANAARNRAAFGAGRLEWLDRLENVQTGEVLEQFICTEHHQQRQHRIVRRRRKGMEGAGENGEEDDMRLINALCKEDPWNMANFDTVVEVIQRWRPAGIKFEK